MNFINMGLFEASIDVSPLPSGKKKAVLNIDTNGFVRVGSVRIPDDGHGTRKLDIKNGAHSVYEDVAPFSNKVFCKTHENKMRFTSNQKDAAYKEKNGSIGLYLIAIPFRKRIAQIIPSEGVTIYKTCFTSCNQVPPKRPFVWAPETKDKKEAKRFEYTKTLYIVAEVDVSDADHHSDVVGTIKIVESGMKLDEAQKIFETDIDSLQPVDVTVHNITVTLRANMDDQFTVGDNVEVTNSLLYPHTIPIERVTLTGDDAKDMANRIIGYTPII